MASKVLYNFQILRISVSSMVLIITSTHEFPPITSRHSSSEALDQNVHLTAT